MQFGRQRERERERQRERHREREGETEREREREMNRCVGPSPVGWKLNIYLSIYI